MQDHLKHRLTGAAILVVVVVLLVPEMFRGRPGVSIDRGVSSLEGPPIRSYTIDLRDGGVAQPPSATPPAPPSATPPMAATSPSSAVTPVSPAATVASATGSAPAPAAPPAAAPPALVPAPARAAAAPPATPGAAKRTASIRAGWTVQVGIFARRDFAERMAKQVRARGFAVEVAGPDDHGRFRVRTAPVADRAAALAMRQRMLVKGLKPIVSRTP